MSEAQAAPKLIPGTLGYSKQVFEYVQSGWITSGGAAASVPGVVQGITGITIRDGRIVLAFTLNIGGNPLPARLEITATVIALVIDPAFRVQMAYKLPYWNTLLDILKGKETPVKGTEYAITLPPPSSASVKVPDITVAAGADPTITLDFPAPYPKVGSGMLWAYLRAITFDPQGATLDIYRPVLGFDLAKNPRILWAQ